MSVAEKRGKILVIRGGAIGDFILTLPAISALRTNFPETHLELLAYPRVAELARAAGIVDGFRSIEARPLARFFARKAELDPEWSAYFESFHVIVSYLFDPDDNFKTNIARTTGAQFIQAQHRPDESQDLHATAVFLKPLERLAIFDADPVPKLTLSHEDDLSGQWLAAHPGSGSEKKNWPEAHWLELLTQLLARRSANILLVGGEAEGDRLNRIASSLPAGRVRLASNLPLSQLARLLVQTRAFIGHDSGITHIAAALGLPTLVLWGPSKASIWRPISPNVQLLNAPAGDLFHLDPKTVQAALDLLF
jgi:heptosyltransferase III